VPTLASYATMMQRARKREGLRLCRAAWLVGVSVREYREIEAGDRDPNSGTYERISELYGFPRTFVISASAV
jgi:transcriptional regulator with XRE-family HTH domain